ncbi:MAG TPA: F0F1 ATP synthase subunit A, partial [Stenotrophomonas sp.]|nr:F0F1 ATP synthase subunit A [Stenotrophomonas sp.]
MAGEALTPTSYIQHHLQNLVVMRDSPWALHLDTLATSLLMGLVMVFGFWLATRKATAGVPGKWQAFVEICLEFVD